jgi:hypothetical protein
MHSLLMPVLALVVWTLIVWIWMYATRIPALQKARLDPQKFGRHTADLAVLPHPARSVADNYNHLMEQPTIFYALAFYIVLAGHTDALNVGLAWGYVALRVLHSLIQNTVNIVLYRFLVFSLSTAVLAIMAIKEVLALG